MFTRWVKLPYRGFTNAFDYYGVKDSFEIIRIPILDWRMEDISGRSRVRTFLITWSFVLYSLIFVFIRMLRRGRPQFIYIRGLPIAFVFSLLRPVFGVPVIFETQEFSRLTAATSDGDIMYGRTKSPDQVKRIEIVEDFVFIHIDGIVVGTNLLREAIASTGIPKKKIFVLPDGFDRARFNVGLDKRQLRKKLNLPKNDKLVAYAGNLFRWKGVETMIEALLHIPSKSVKMLIVGGLEWEPHLRRLKDLASDLRVRDRTLFVGYVLPSQVPYYLGSADLLVIPTLDTIMGKHSMPTKIFEDMATGRPILASDLQAHRQILKNNQTGLFFKPNNPEDLACKIREILRDKDLAKKMGQEAYRQSGKYIWEKRAERIGILVDRLTTYSKDFI